MNGASTILVVDDEPDVRQLIRALLEKAGHTIREADGGRSALRVLYEASPALVILDVTMPDLDGWQTLERIRDMTNVPVLMLTARQAELDRIRGLNSGADDYVSKPFSHGELLARVNALLRRGGERADQPEQIYTDRCLIVDFVKGTVEVEGIEVSLTPLEFRLLAAFVRHPNHVLSREQLLELVWHDPYGVAPEQVRLYVGYLRRKLGSATAALETVRGFGYRYRPPREDGTQIEGGPTS
jgi:DNA-binding response OmpR family regulator